MREMERMIWNIGREGAAYAAQWNADNVRLPYLSPDWLEALSEGMGFDVRVHAVIQDGRMKAVAAFRRASRYGIAVGRKPWATAYNVWVAEGVEDVPSDFGLLEHLIGHYVSVRGVFAPCHGRPLVDRRRSNQTLWRTLLLDVRSVEECWARCDRHARQRVRKARELGVAVAASEDADAFELLYRLTYGRQGLPCSLPEGAVARTLGRACRSGNIELYVATAAGEPAAGLVVGWGADSAYFMLAASHPELRKTDAVTLLWWTVIERASQRVSTVDLVGAATPEIERFKRSFSPSAADCLEVVCEAWPLRFAAKAGAWLGRNAKTAAALPGRASE